MTQRAPIVNEAFIQARKQERAQAGQKQGAVAARSARRLEPVARVAQAVPANEGEGATVFSAAVTPTLTVEVERPAPQRARVVVPAVDVPKPALKPALKKKVPQAKRKIKQLPEPQKGFLWSAWKLFFGMLMGINIGISLIIAGLLIYGAVTGDFWKWIPIK